MNAGDTFRFTKGDPHLWMIISDPVKNPDAVLAVHFSTWESWRDQACIIQPGEHPFIRHKSVIEYGRAKMESNATWEAVKADKILIVRQPLTAALLCRIRQCSFHSRLLQDWRHALMDQGLIDLTKLKPVP